VHMKLSHDGGAWKFVELDRSSGGFMPRPLPRGDYQAVLRISHDNGTETFLPVPLPRLKRIPEADAPAGYNSAFTIL
jgi:hypothetical protein